MADNEKNQLLAAVAAAGSIGFYTVAAVAVGLFGGRLADQWLGTGPWGAVAGIVLGMAAGLWGVYKRLTGKE